MAHAMPSGAGSTARRQVIVGDGAKRIWSVGTELYPRAVQIVDFCLVAERLWAVARALIPDDRARAGARAAARCADLKKERIHRVLARLRIHADNRGTAAKCLGCIGDNSQRMRYSRFRDLGLRIGSGVVEGGMRRTVDGADAIMALRCRILSGRYEAFWESRAEVKLAKAA